MKQVRIFVRTPYNYDGDAVSRISGLACPEVTRAQQQFRDECDINTIVERFGLTGELPVGGRMPTYGDFRLVTDFHTAMQAVRESQEMFMQLPGLVRERFGQDPAKFVDFCLDPANLEECRKLGLAPPAPEALEPSKALVAT